MEEKVIPTKLLLDESELPKCWYNLKAILPHEPALNPATLKPCTVEDFKGVFCDELIEQELNEKDEYIEIPDEVIEFYKKVRPSPLIRAYDLEKVLDTPAEIYYKFEGNNTSGSHKLNSAIPQAYYAKKQGLKYLTTETGAGQWGTALSMASAYYGLGLTVYMVKGSAEQKPFRKAVIETYGAKVVPSPSNTTKVGREILEKFPNTTGSLGCAVSEAVEKATETSDCKYVLGSVMDHVILHQTIIGLETKTALEKFGIEPDILISCVGGGSNFGGFVAPFMKDKINGTKNYRIIGVEPKSCPSLTRGKYVYDYGDTGKITPLMKMYTLGSSFIPPAVHAGGLRYHGMAPQISNVARQGLMSARTVQQLDVFRDAVIFARAEGITPAPESSHAISAAMDEARKCKESGESRAILFNLSGHGHMDMAAYIEYFAGSLKNYDYSEEEIAMALSGLPSL